MGGASERCGGDGHVGRHRLLYPGGKLGFHAPRIQVPPQQFHRTVVESAYDAAIFDLASLLDASDNLEIPRSLILSMMKKGGGDFLFIDDVNKAGRWGIDIHGGSIGAWQPKSLVTACRNARAWIYRSHLRFSLRSLA
jgi:hypothetical protein